MFKFVNLFVLIICLSPCLLFSETHLSGELEGDQHWDIEGSPYIIEETVYIAEGDSLTIEPGVWVIINAFEGIVAYNSVVKAIGTPEDSIWFVAIDSIDGWRSIALGGMESSGRFEYCHFYGSYGWWEGQGALADINSAVVRNCTFRWCGSGISMVSGGIIEDCHFDSMFIQGIDNASEELFHVRRCVFNHIRWRAAVSGANAIILNCIIMNCERYALAASRSTVLNNILIHNYGVFLTPPRDNIGYNCIYDYQYLYFDNSGGPREGLAEIDRVNENGDSTDAFGNLFVDPLLVEGENEYPEYYYLQAESPCIDAGEPMAPLDPDSTRSDIGAFFFPQQNISVDPDTLEFTDIQTGLSDSVSVTIHNIGLDTLQVDSLFIIQEGEIFSLSLDEDEFILEPDSSSMIRIVFSPIAQAQYEAVLTIASNDRDQGMFEIPITASALSVSDESIDIPDGFVLFAVYPNPFNSTTTISFGLGLPAPTRLMLYDLSGREVRTLFKGYKQAGFHSANLNAGDLSSGIYFVRLNASNQVFTQKVMLIR
jgi:hypothetical protein